mgnify:CR=1 FL=1|jgi:predicted membrane protein
MDFLFSKLFWGTIVILIGLSIIINAVFKIDFPFFRVVISIIIIFFGLRMLLGSFGVSTKNLNQNEVVFSQASANPSELELKNEYSVVFGNQTIDMRSVNLEEDKEIEFNAVFGKQIIMLPKDLNVRVKASAVFGNARLPDDRQVAFGDMTYQEKSAEGMPILYVEANVVFGQVRFIRSN